MTKPLLLLALLALAGCAATPSTGTADGECAKRAETSAVLPTGQTLPAGRCVEWTFGPSRKQAREFEENRARLIP